MVSFLTSPVLVQLPYDGESHYHRHRTQKNGKFSRKQHIIL